MVEIYEYNGLVLFESSEMDPEDIMKYWVQRFPSITDNIEIWDDLVHQRTVYAKNVSTKYSHLLSVTTDMQIETLYQCIQAMCNQKNYGVCDCYIQDAALLGTLQDKLKVSQIQLNLRSLLESGRNQGKSRDNKDIITNLLTFTDKMNTYMVLTVVVFYGFIFFLLFCVCLL